MKVDERPLVSAVLCTRVAGQVGSGFSDILGATDRFTTGQPTLDLWVYLTIAWLGTTHPPIAMRVVAPDGRTVLSQPITPDPDDPGRHQTLACELRLPVASAGEYQIDWFWNGTLLNRRFFRVELTLPAASVH